MMTIVVNKDKNWNKKISKIFVNSNYMTLKSVTKCDTRRSVFTNKNRILTLEFNIIYKIQLKNKFQIWLLWLFCNVIQTCFALWIPKNHIFLPKPLWKVFWHTLPCVLHWAIKPLLFAMEEKLSSLLEIQWTSAE